MTAKYESPKLPGPEDWEATKKLAEGNDERSRNARSTPLTADQDNARRELLNLCAMLEADANAIQKDGLVRGSILVHFVSAAGIAFAATRALLEAMATTNKAEATTAERLKRLRETRKLLNEAVASMKRAQGRR